MRTFVRYLLWLLIAALPLQGGAVALMSSGVVAAEARASSHGIAKVALDEDHPDAHREHCHDGDNDQGASSHGKCSHCASCCVGAAAPPAAPSARLPATFSTFVAIAPEPAMTAYIPATLERPPRRHV